MGVYGYLLCFGACLKWLSDELQFLALPHGLHFTPSEVAAWSGPLFVNILQPITNRYFILYYVTLDIILTIVKANSTD